MKTLGVRWKDETKQDLLIGTKATRSQVDGVRKLLDDMGVETCTLEVLDMRYVFERSKYNHMLYYSSVLIAGQDLKDDEPDQSGDEGAGEDGDEVAGEDGDEVAGEDGDEVAGEGKGEPLRTPPTWSSVLQERPGERA